MNELSLVYALIVYCTNLQESVSDQSIPAYPMLIDASGGSTDLSDQGNQIAIMLNGVTVFRSVSLLGVLKAREPMYPRV